MSRTYEALQKAGTLSDKGLHPVKDTKRTIKVHNTEKKAKKKHIRPEIINQFMFVDLKDTNEIGVLAQRIERISMKSKSKVFHFTSSRKGEGTSTITANLISHIMEKKHLGNVLFIDANLENPVYHTAFGINLKPGLCELLKNEVKHEDVITRVGKSNVHIIPAGFASSIESSNLVQNNLITYINQIRKLYDHILIESSPIFTSSDALAVAVASDTTALVVQAGRTEFEIVEKALQIFRENECNIEGLVLNRVRHVIPKWLYNRI
ncbi:hypothetical protein DSCA_20140 [Desulfosarcina alkanivorans]|jgi:capsular exopolysaccharide synthesis family protein|uniref:non-specific protein-tyrosine kinase n=1 Tax=Desulfosarcina alkanivorans TaxID=571177 RepID=A0A5K7YNZ6_9BACT|nr:CpsD/CapB family tyrosine-protein kinase [Desulfosarcina alkanivorans]BBO68084.1 hypothetical protein DSCA_20140 [Desulfosarcina alkanivorans]